MTKNILVLNRVDIEESPYHLWLDTSKYNIYLLTAKEKFKNAEHVCSEYKEIHYFDNYVNNANVEVCAVELAKRVKFDGVVAYSEADIIRAARIREALGLPGQGVENAVIYRDKLEMRKQLLQTGLRCPDFMAINSAIELDGFIAQHGYPIIIKPRFGMAAIGVKKIDNKDELSEFLTNKLYSDPDIAQPLIAETFVKGDVYAIDVIVAEDKIVVAEPLLYLDTCLSYASSDSKTVGLSQVCPTTPVYDKLISFSHTLIERFPHCGYGGFHIEVFVDEDLNITLCEVASRNGGGKIPQIFEQVRGVNPDGISVRLQASLGTDLVWIDESLKSGFDGTIGFIIMSPGNYDYGWSLPKTTPFDFVTEYEPNFEVESTVENVASLAAIVTVIADDIEGLKNNMLEFTKWFYQE